MFGIKIVNSAFNFRKENSQHLLRNFQRLFRYSSTVLRREKNLLENCVCTINKFMEIERPNFFTFKILNVNIK